VGAPGAPFLAELAIDLIERVQIEKPAELSEHRSNAHVAAFFRRHVLGVPRPVLEKRPPVFRHRQLKPRARAIAYQRAEHLLGEPPVVVLQCLRGADRDLGVEARLLLREAVEPDPVVRRIGPRVDAHRYTESRWTSATLSARCRRTVRSVGCSTFA